MVSVSVTKPVLMVEERVTKPAVTPVKLAVYTPLPAFTVLPRVPDPGVEVAAKATVVIPDGFKFPKISFAVRVVVIESPEATVAEFVVTSESASEKAAGEILIKLEQSVLSPPELALR
jgi:hypothetical protein